MSTRMMPGRFAVVCHVIASFACAASVAACYSPVSYPDGVFVEKVKYEKRVLFRGSNMNLVSDLQQGDFDRDGADEVLAVAGDGIHLLELDGREKRFTPFRSAERPWAVRAVTGMADGRLRFIGNLPNVGQTVLFDESGAVVWTAPGASYGEPIAADLDGDGRVEVVSPGGAGLDVRSLDGVSLREFTAAGRPLYFDCMDMDGDGRADVVAENFTDGRNRMAIFAGDGRPLAHWMSPQVFNRFGVVTGTGGTRPSLMVLSDGVEELVFFDVGGNVVRSLRAPWGNRLSRPRGMTMRVAGADAGFVCLGTSKGSRHHHITYVYGAGGDLVYADSAVDDANAVLALLAPQAGGGSPSFLVGSRNVIWKYVEKR